MSNAAMVKGLWPIRHKNGSVYNGQANLYYVGSGESAMFIGDPVIVTGTADARGIPAITLATAGATHKITGVIVGFKVLPNDLSKVYNPASTARYALVCDDPMVVFGVTADTTAALAVTDISTNANLTAGGGGSTVTGLSSWMLASTSMTADATYQLTIERLINRDDNALGSTYAQMEVSINLHSKMSYAIAGI